MSKSILADSIDEKILTGGRRTSALNERILFKQMVNESFNMNDISADALTGGEIIPLIQGGVSKNVTLDILAGFIGGGGGGSQSFADVMGVSNVYNGGWFSTSGQSEIRNDGTIYLNWTNGTQQSNVYIESSKSVMSHYDASYSGEFLTETEHLTQKFSDSTTGNIIGDFTITPDYLQAVYSDLSTYENKMYFDPGGIFLRFSDLADKQAKLIVSSAQVELKWTDGTVTSDFLSNVSETHFSHTTQIRFDSPLYNFVGATPDSFAYFDSSGNLTSAGSIPASSLSDVLAVGNSTGGQDILSPDTYSYAFIKNSGAQIGRNNLSGSSYYIGGTDSQAIIGYTNTNVGAVGYVLITDSSTAITHTSLISFDSPLYNFTNLTASKLLGLDASNNLITYDIPPIFSPVDPSNLAWGAGAMASATTGALYNVAIGQNSLNSLTTGINNVIVGDTGGQNITTGSSNLMFGDDTYVTTGSISFSIVIGAGGHATDSNQLIIGGSGAPILNAYIGQGVSHPDAKLWIGDLNLYNATVSRAVYVDSSKNIAYSVTTNTELAYLSGVTSAIQTQLNGKEASITASTSAKYWRGDKTFQTLDTSVVPENTNLYWTTARTLSTALSGLSITGSAISSTDTILQAFGKIQNQINGVLGGAIYKGTYNATTNTPTLIDGTGTQGYYYVVNVAGNQNFGSGVINFNVGDWVIFNGAIWQKVDNTDAVSDVNGSIGSISLIGTANRITVTSNTWDIAATYVGQTSITTLGTIATGVWHGTAIADTYISSATAWNAKLDGSGVSGRVAVWNGAASETSFSTFLYSTAGATIATGGVGLSLIGGATKQAYIGDYSGAGNSTYFGVNDATSTAVISATTIQFLGATITAGIWQGTAISDTYISSAATWNAKQAALVSGTNIKTVNGTTLLGSGNLQTTGYVINLDWTNTILSPVDATTYYFGILWNAVNPTVNIRVVRVPKAGTIVKATVSFYNSVLGSSETSSMWIRLNNITDILISNAITNDLTKTNFSSGTLSTAVIEGDLIEVKWTTPTWATNPTILCKVMVYIE